MKQILLFGIPIQNVTMEQAVAQIQAGLRSHACDTIIFVNAHCVNVAHRDAEYQKILLENSYNYADGVGMQIAAQLFGTPLVDNVNGTDLFPRLCPELEKIQARIFLLGGAPGVAEILQERMEERYAGIRITGTHHGYFSPDEQEQIIKNIRASGAELLLVAMGVPLQEKWIAAWGEQTGVRVAMAVGGLFNFYSGRIPRAPKWMRRLGLEWLHRMFQEPRRLWKRYLIGNILFLYITIRWKFYLWK
ncbi:MAG: WecB/TagA/CpsF family glycosyltransferase [bacterium]